MAAPSPLVIALERMEAIAAVRKTVTPSRVGLQAGGVLEAEKALPEQPLECPKVEEAKTEEESVEWTVAPFRGDGRRIEEKRAPELSLYVETATQERTIRDGKLGRLHLMGRRSDHSLEQAWAAYGGEQGGHEPFLGEQTG